MRLTRPQQLIYDSEKVIGGSVAVMCGIMTVDKVYPEEQVVAAIRTIYQTNDALNYKLDDSGSEPRMYYEDPGDRTVNVVRVEDLSELEEIGERIAKTPMDLSGWLSDLTAIIHPNGYGVIVTLHHILGDAWSMSLVGTQLNAILEGTPWVRYSYEKYIEAEEEYLVSRKYERDRQFFLDEFRRCGEPLLLSDKQTESYCVDVLTYSLPSDLRSCIYEYSQKNDISEFAVVFGAFSAFYGRVKNCAEDFFIGMPVLNRISETELNTIGMYVNTVPVHIHFDYGKTVADNLEDLQDSIFSAFKHQKFNYNDIMKALSEECGFQGKLYDCTFNYETDEILSLNTMRSKEYHREMQTEGVQIFFQNRNRGEEITVEYTFHRDVYSAETIERYHSMFMRVLDGILTDDTTLLKDINILGKEEKEKVVVSFNHTSVDYDKDKSVYDLFSEQAGKETGACINDGLRTYGFAQMDSDAAKTDAYIRNRVGEEKQVVGVLCDRSYEELVSIFGIIRGGNAYMPISPQYPAERIRTMLETSGCRLVIAQKQFAGMLDCAVSIEDILSGPSADIPDAAAKPDDTLYVIYTSGSTGTPKGAMVSNRSAINRIGWMADKYFDSSTVVMRKTPYTFDVSVWEIFGFAMYGFSLYILPPDAHYNQREVLDHIEKGQVTDLHFVPTVFEQFLSVLRQASGTKQKLASLRHVILSGESLLAKDVNEFNKYHDGKASVHNLYGPAECAVDVTSYDCKESETDPVPIGKPIANTQIYIVDKHMKPVPIGVTGELCIAGDNVGQGYLNRPELTREKFVDNPFGEGKLYRTGDLAFWREDGNIVFAGRNDYQIKINGQRVELGEIEAALCEAEGIDSAAATVQKDGDGGQMLCAFYSGKEISPAELRSLLGKTLPKHMIPHSFTYLETMPLTTSGKIDRKALELLPVEIASEEYEAPVTEEEKELTGTIEEVLGIKNVGINDNYYALGGDSIRAIHIVSEMYSKGYSLSVPDLMQADTLKDAAAKAERAATKNNNRYEPFAGLSLNERNEIEKRYGDNVADAYAMTPAQEGIYAQSGKNGGRHTYHLQQLIRLTRENPQITKERVSEMMQAHEALRTAFVPLQSGGRVLQLVFKSREPAYKFETINSPYDEKTVEEYIKKDADLPYDLEKDTLIRITVLSFTDSDIVLCSAHHIITDGWSLNLLAGELLRNEFVKEGLSFAQYLNMSHEDNSQEAYDYWNNLLRDASPVHLFSQRFGSEPADVMFEIFETDVPADETEQFAVNTGITVNTLFESAFAVLLQRYSASDDVLFLKAVSGRGNIAGSENTVGPFLNTVPVRVAAANDTLIREFLHKNQQQGIDAEHYGTVSLAGILRNAGLKTEDIDALFAFENYYYSSAHESQSKQLRKQLLMYREQTEFPLSVTTDRQDGVYRIRFAYNPMCFDESQIKALAQSYCNILLGISEHPEFPLSEIDALTVRQKKQLAGFNDTFSDYDKDKSVYDLFSEQAGKETGACINDGLRTYGFAQMDSDAAKTDAYIRNRVGEEKQVVGVLCDRSYEELVSIFGIIRGGNAYMPISPQYPAERIRTMLETSGCRLVIAQKQFAGMLDCAVSIEDILSGPSADIPDAAAKPDDTLYVIYTSGSTGTPKGAMVSNRSAINRIGWMADKYFDSSTVVMRKTPYTFDVSVWEIFGFAMYGFSLYILPPDAHYNQREVLDHIEKGQVTDLHFVPTVFEQFLSVLRQASGTKQKLASLRHVILSGESLLAKDVNEFNKYHDGKASVHNLYGPAECAVDVTSYDCKESETDPVPIGKPIANTQIYIVDKHMKPVPIGVTGELCIAGDNVGQGYLNRPELTREKFVDNPFGEGKLYRTGDLAFWREDGNIVFAGRNDYQIKINGQRVELGEIEAALCEAEGIDSAAATVQKDGDGGQMLCAFYSGKEISPAELRSLLGKTLPKHMIPHSFTYLETMPLTTSGKIDRKALELLPVEIASEEYEAPVTEEEKELTGTIEEVLGIKNVGINDNYYALGGDSIRAIHIVSEMYSKGYSLSVPDLMQADTLKDAAAKAETVYSIKPVDLANEDHIIPLSPIAQAYLKTNPADPSAFCQSCIVRIQADAEAITTALKELAKCHEMLRAVRSGESMRILTEEEFNSRFKVNTIELNGEENSFEKARELLLSRDIYFSFDEGLLLDVALCKLTSGCVMRISIHHFIVDLFSWEILLSDLKRIVLDKAPATRTTAPYAQWLKTIMQYKSEMPPDELAYWMQIKSRLEQTAPLCNDSDSVVPGEILDFSLEPEISSALLETEKQGGAKLNVMLLAALGCCAARISGGPVGICVEGHGRNIQNTSLTVDRTVGWFTSIYPVIVDRTMVDDNLLFSVNRDLQKVPENGIGWLLQNREIPDNTNLLFNFYRYRKSELQDAEPVFETGKSALNSMFANMISVDCELRNDVITVHIRAPHLHRKRDLLQKLADGFVQAAREISEIHPVQEKLPDVPDCFSDSALSESEWSALDSIFNRTDTDESD